MSVTKAEVTAFLSRLQTKAKIFQIIYEDDRQKNVETLAALEITPKKRDEVILNLTVRDYYKGPRPERFFGGDAEMYEFGKEVNGQEIYIKVTLGRDSSPVICISFHIAERAIQYPFK